MEEAKLADFAELRSEDSMGTFWQWQSGPSSDPWAETDPVKWTWQRYSYEDSLIIEKAFSLKKEKADLKDYEVDFRRMLQVRKDDAYRIRRVRRQERSRFTMGMSKPIVIPKDQKTMNEAFGTIQHFLSYIMKRTLESHMIYQKLRSLSLDCKDTEFQDIIQEVIACIRRAATTRQKVIMTRADAQNTNFSDEVKDIVGVIRGSSTSLGDFLKAILKVYTTESFLCYWLNELLRGEDWEEINVLTPYLVCLVHIFKLSEYVLKYQEPEGLIDTFLAFIGTQKLYLYRGAALTKEHLDAYNPEKMKYFSWNAVTSTSREKSVALDFIKFSLERAKEFEKPMIGVLFKIEMDFTSSEDCEGTIDTLEHSCSRHPDEKEVLLAPGTVFELLETSIEEDDISEISLKVTKKFEETKDSCELLGNLLEQAIFQDKGVIEGVPSQESSRVLDFLRGNELVRKLEIRHSKIEDHIIEEIEILRQTTNVRREDVIFVDNTIIIGNLDPFVPYISLENVNNLCTWNKVELKEGVPKSYIVEKSPEMKTLVLNESTLEKFQRNNQLEKLGEKIKNASQIANLDLCIKKLESKNPVFLNFLQCVIESKLLQSLRIKINRKHPISKDDFQKLCKTLGSSSSLKQLEIGLTLSNKALRVLDKALASIISVENISFDLKFDSETSNKELHYFTSAIILLPSLQHLSLNFDSNDLISDEGLDHLRSALTSLKSLQYLSLDFRRCSKISDEGLYHIKDMLILLRSLQSLSLNFSWCSKISDGGLDHLKNGLFSNLSLQQLSLDFSGCDKISDDGLNHMKSALISLTSLEHLSLNFTWCKEISDEGLNHLRGGFISFKSLHHLSLSFKGCIQISEKGLNYLKCALILLRSLQHISLDFQGCSNISDEGLYHLKSTLIPPASLQHLSMNFEWCHKISDEALYQLKSALRFLGSLQHISFGFRWCSKVSDEGLNYLKDALISLTSLRHLSLDFAWCTEISDEGLSHLKSGIISLIYLQDLSFNFQGCSKISDEGLNHLKSSIISLTYLQYLSLNFTLCTEISDEGLNHLKSVLMSATSLQSLSLNFEQCSKVTDEGLKNLKTGFILFRSLNHLSLNFKRCVKISDKGLNHFKNALISLISLQKLSLDFNGCSKVSSEGLNHLKGALISLISLQHLSLDFSYCWGITDEGLNHLKNALISFRYLQSLSLNFRWCSKISDEGLNHLKSGITSLYYLQQLTLHFHNHKISEEGLKNFRSELKFIPSLTC